MLRSRVVGAYSRADIFRLQPQGFADLGILLNAERIDVLKKAQAWSQMG